MATTRTPHDLVYLSKQMSYLLRHGAIKEGLPISKAGFVSIEDMVKHTRASSEDIMECVETSDKQRYTVQDINGKMHIRANQGHSIAVEDLELKKVTSAKEIPIVVHGTYNKSWSIIKNDGLSKMGRNHIHFASGRFDDKTVISGMRKTAEVLIYVDAEKAMNGGIVFFTSANGVILTEGDERGYLPSKYFSRVVNSKGAELELPPIAPSTATSSSTSTTPSTTDPSKKTRRSKKKPKSQKNIATTTSTTQSESAVEEGEEQQEQEEQEKQEKQRPG